MPFQILLAMIHTLKEVLGNDAKKARVEHKEERTQCSTCGKYHKGTCREEKTSSSSSSSQGVTPGKYDKWKGSKDKKRKNQSITNDDNDLLVLQQEISLNKLTEHA